MKHETTIFSVYVSHSSLAVHTNTTKTEQRTGCKVGGTQPGSENHVCIYVCLAYLRSQLWHVRGVWVREVFQSTSSAVRSPHNSIPYTNLPASSAACERTILIYCACRCANFRVGGNARASCVRVCVVDEATTRACE